jgi:hypothetical protein
LLEERATGGTSERIRPGAMGKVLAPGSAGTGRTWYRHENPGALTSRKERIEMATSDFKKALASTRELEITVTGRKSGRKISTPVWFTYEGDVLYLLPVKGSDSQWYKNVVSTPTMDLAAGGREVTVKPKRITDSNGVKEIVEKFRAKYGAADVKKYYSKFDVCLEIVLND